MFSKENEGKVGKLKKNEFFTNAYVIIVVVLEEAAAAGPGSRSIALLRLPLRLFFDFQAAAAQQPI